MTNNASTPKAESTEFKPVKKLSPFVSDPHNTRGGKGGKKGAAVVTTASVVKAAKNVGAKRLKGGSGGDR